MKKIITMLGLLSIAATAFAAPATLTGALSSGPVQNLGVLTISQAPSNQLTIEFDRNLCQDGTPGCSEVGFMPLVVDPQIISDQRRNDGDLVLQLTSQIKLDITSGFSPQGVEYTALVTKRDGTVVKVPMKAVVSLEVEQPVQAGRPRE